MVDFNQLRTKKKKPYVIDPLDIFRRLAKPPGINDLYTSQASVLQAWFERRKERDIILKLHTGGGKTLVGLLAAQSTLNELREPVLYLSPTVQLVNQTIEKAKALGINAVAYEKGQQLNDDFVNAKAIMVATYKALFHGLSKFGLRGGRQQIQKVAAVILDDAHAAFSVVRDSFTLEVSNDNRELYQNLTGLFRMTFKATDKLGTFDDIVSGADNGVIEVPYWAWHEKIDAVREQLTAYTHKYRLIWPLLRDQLRLCHALISCKSFTITSILPLVTAFPTFAESPRRIYMSATIADDSEIISTFDADPQSVKNALSSRSLAGISERMILIPELMRFEFNSRDTIEKLIQWASENNFGAVVLVPTDAAATDWQQVATVAKGSSNVENLVEQLQSRQTSGPVVFANRYDGIDLPGDSCRFLVMYGLPYGTSNYELFRASALYGGATMTRMLAQRIEQGIGRGARGSGDYCVVILAGKDLVAWIAKDTNFRFLTSATRAQLEIGTEISKEIKSIEDLAQTITRSFNRDTEWTEYHAEYLAELMDDDVSGEQHYDLPAAERKTVNLWRDGYHGKAIAKITTALSAATTLDPQLRGWMEQLAARIADEWGNNELAEELQRKAFGHNRNLIKPKILPPYKPLSRPSEQAEAIVQQIGAYKFRRGFLQSFEEVVTFLNQNASSNQFEKSLAELARMIGFCSERFDDNGNGPDVLWLLPGKTGLVIEAKSRKKIRNAFTKEQHGQLLVAEEWFKENYKGYKCVRVSVHPKNLATKAAVAGASHALTYQKLASLVSDARVILSALCSSQLSSTDLVIDCGNLLTNSPLNAKKFLKNYLLPFQEVD